MRSGGIYIVGEGGVGGLSLVVSRRAKSRFCLKRVAKRNESLVRQQKDIF